MRLVRITDFVDVPGEPKRERVRYVNPDAIAVIEDGINSRGEPHARVCFLAPDGRDARSSRLVDLYFTKDAQTLVNELLSG